MSLDPNLKVLVIDDMMVMRKMVMKILTDLQLTNVTQAEDGQQALELIAKATSEGQPFQFVISDWNMPNMTGIELLKKLRGHPKFKQLPFLMVTAEGEKENIVAAVQAGVSDFVIKPFTKDTLGEKIIRVLGAKAA